MYVVQLVKLCFLACVSASYPAPCVRNFFTINGWFDALNVMLAHQIIGPLLLGSCNPLRPRSQAHVTYSQSQIKHNFVPRHCWEDHVRPQWSVSWFRLLQIFMVVARALFFVSPICKWIIIQIGNDYYFRKTVWLTLRT